MTNAIADILKNNRVTQGMLKQFTKMQASTFASSKFLIDIARGFGTIDLPAAATDADIMTMYGIIPEGNADVDPRIALGVLINKGGPEMTKIINAILRDHFMPNGDIKLPENAAPPAPTGTQNRGQWLEVKNEGGNDDSVSDMRIRISGNNAVNPPSISDPSQIDQNAENFPPCSKITRPKKDVSDFLMTHINQNANILKSEKMVCINDLIDASGLSINIGNWVRNEDSKRYVAAVADLTKKSQEEVFFTRRGGSEKQGTWAHMSIAFEIARWIDPYFSVMVNDIVMRVMSGDLSLVPEIVDQFDKLNGTSTNLATVGAVTGDQIRQTTVDSAVLDSLGDDELTRRAKINAQSEAFNWSVLRPLNFECPVTREMLYKTDHDGRVVIAKEPDHRSAVTSIECFLKALYPEDFRKNDVTNLYGCIEMMWYIIADYENGVRGSSMAQYQQCDNSAEMERARDKITELEKANLGLASHISNLKNISRLKEILVALNKTHSYDMDSIKNYISSVINQEYEIEQDAVTALNWHLTNSLGQDHKSHLDFRNLVAVINDISHILRAEFSAPVFELGAPRDFGSIFEDGEPINRTSKKYWEEINAEINVFSCAPNYQDEPSEDETSTPAAPGNPENAYDRIAPMIKKRGPAPTRAAAVKKASELPDEFRLAFAKYIEERANSMPMAFAPNTDDYSLYFYFGQVGYAGNIVPRISSSTPKLMLMICMREIIDAGAWHLRPAGLMYLLHPMNTQKAVAKLSSATDKERKPVVKPINPGAVALTRVFTVDQYSRHTTIHTMISAVAEAIGKTSITMVIMPADHMGKTWKAVNPGGL